MKRTLVALICLCVLATVGYSNIAARDFQDDKQPPNYDIYIGQYQVAEGVVLTITNEKGKLMGQPTGHDKAEFKAEASPDKFYSSEVNGWLKFVRDETSAVIGVVLTIEGKDFPSKKIQ